MSYLDKYKTGSMLFRMLSEGRMRFRAIRNAFRYSHPAPNAVISIHDVDAPGTYKKKSEASLFSFPRSQITPEAARPILEKQTQTVFPETFVLRVPGGRVLGDGTIVTPQNKILSESTTDFHRKQEYHHLLSERRVPAPERFEGRLAVITSPGSDNYFHWTLDSLPRLGLLAGMEKEIDGYYIDCRGAFHREWLERLEIPAEKIIAAGPERHLEADELSVPSFKGLPGLPSPKGVEFIRSFMPPQTSRKQRVFVSRARARRRRLLNEQDLMPLFKRHGFEIIHPGEMTVKEQMQVFSSASVVVSPHGAELTNLIFCSQGTRVIELFSPYYLNPCFKQLAAVCGLNHTAMVGKGGEKIVQKRIDAHHVWANITANPSDIEKALSTILP